MPVFYYRIPIKKRRAARLSSSWKKPHAGTKLNQPKKTTMATQNESIRLRDLTPNSGITVHYADIVLEFGHIDGMYSYNTIKEGRSKGNIFHISASSPLKKISEREYEVLI